MEEYLQQIGEFGKFQMGNFFLLSLPTIVVAMQKFAWVFLGVTLKHRCKLPWEGTNASYPLSSFEFGIYYPIDETTRNPSQCKIYSNISQSLTSNIVSGNAESCDEYVFDTSEHQSSAVIDFHLVCDRTWMGATVQSMFMVGMLIGSYLFGDLSDRFGRKPVFMSALVMMVVVGVGQVIILDYYFFIITRFILGGTLQGIFLIAYVIMMEMVGKGKRVIVGVWAHGFYSMAYFTGALLAYLIDQWRWLQVAYTLPALLFAPYYWIIPESARWLSAKGRRQEAMIVLRKAAKVNGVKIDERFVSAAATPPPGIKEGNFLDLFRYKSLRIKTVVVFFIWMVNSGVYYGLSLNTGNLGGNDYVNFMISGAVEIPGLALASVTLMKIGRRLPLCFLMLAAGVALLLTIAVPKEESMWLTTLAMAGKLCITASYAAIYTFTVELYPTVVRNVAIGSSSMIARVGGALSPYVNLLGDYWTPLPLIVFGVLSVISGVLALALPETKGKPMQELISENIEAEPLAKQNDTYKNFSEIK